MMWSTAALVTLYQPMPGSTSRPPIDAMLITDPAETRLHGGGRPDQHGQLVDLERLLGPHEVDVDHRAEVGVRPCVVDQDVDATESGHRVGDAGRGVLGVADMGGAPGDAASGLAPARPARRPPRQVVGLAGR